MNIAGTIRKSMLAIVSVAAMASSLMGAPTDKPKITDTLNDFNPEYPIGIFVQEIVSNQVVSAVILTNGVLSVGSETIAIAQTSHDVVETNVVSGTLVITTNTYYIVYEDGLAKTLKAYATNEKITSIVTNDIGEVTTNWTKVAYLSDIPPAEKKADKMMQTWEFLEPNMDVVLSMTPNTNAPFAYWKWAGDKEAFQSIALYYKEGSWHVSQNGGAFVSTEGDFTNNVVEVGGFTFIATNRAEVMVVYSDQLEDVVIGKLDQYVTNTVNNLIASATNDPTIVRGEKLPFGDNLWNIGVFSALTADQANTAGTASNASSVPWSGVLNRPDTLAGYGVAEEVTNTVCNIVTNEVHSFGDWVEEWNPSQYGTVYSLTDVRYEGVGEWYGTLRYKDGTIIDRPPVRADGGEFATRLVFDGYADGASFTITLTRSHVAENVLGLATTNGVMSAIASATNGLLRTESDPMFTAWTNGTATLSGAFVQGAGFKNALVNNPILASGARAHAQGYATRAYGDNSHAEGASTVASNMNSHAEGESTKALGRGSHAEGYFAVASNDYSHAEGDHTVAGGILSHAGGSYSRAWGDTSRAWGIGATANAAMSVSEGNQTQANGWYSTARGYWTAANGVMSHAEGVNATAEGNPIFSPEDVSDLSDLLATYTWSAVYKGEDTNSNYRSHGPGTYNINPSGGLAGFYVGETNLQTLLGEKASTGDVQAAISAVNPTFSNAVLAVGLNIDTNSVAVINEIASTFGDFPIEGTATTVGGLLAALAAAIAWLRRNKADKTDLEGFATEADLLAFYYPDGNVTSLSQITTSGIEYAVGDDGGAYVVKGNGLTGHVVLPWKVTIGGNEYKVTAIRESAFNADASPDNSFSSIFAPITVKSVGRLAFANYGVLYHASFPAATSIGREAFFYCTTLASVSMPSATSIGEQSFYFCASLASVSMPSVTSVGVSAFAYCHSLASVSMPSAKGIEELAFFSCDSLASVYIPSVASVGFRAFSLCNSLVSIGLPSVASIGELSFANCTSLTAVDFGSSPKSAVPSVSGSALSTFEGVPTSCKFIIPIGMYDEWISASGWSDLHSAGYKFEGYASTAQLADKADKTALDELSAKVGTANAALEEVA